MGQIDISFSMTDDQFSNLTVLQNLALFYREATGPGSQGGYDRLFTDLGPGCPYEWPEERDEIVWKSHWDRCDKLPEIVKMHITGCRSILELAKVRDVPVEFMRRMGDEEAG